MTNRSTTVRPLVKLNNRPRLNVVNGKDERWRKRQRRRGDGPRMRLHEGPRRRGGERKGIGSEGKRRLLEGEIVAQGATWLDWC
jgi:hypothetical protein